MAVNLNVSLVFLANVGSSIESVTVSLSDKLLNVFVTGGTRLRPRCKLPVSHCAMSESCGFSILQLSVD